MIDVVQHTIKSSSTVQIETRVYLPDTADTLGKNNIILFVHPWGLLGGSWYNTDSLARSCTTKTGCTSVICNLRGVGNSTGRSTCCGHSEVQDIVAVSEYVLQQYGASKTTKIWIVAQSAGAASAGTAVQRLGTSCGGIVFVGYLFGCATSVVFGRHYSSVLHCKKKKLFILGTNDCFTTRATMRRVVKRCDHESTLVLLGGVGHFELTATSMDEIVSSLVVQFLRGGGSGETVDGENVRGEKVGSELERVLRDLSVDGEVVEFHGSISSSPLSSCCCCPPWSYCDYCTCWVFWFLSSLVVAVVLVVLSSIDVL